MDSGHIELIAEVRWLRMCCSLPEAQRPKANCTQSSIRSLAHQMKGLPKGWKKTNGIWEPSVDHHPMMIARCYQSLASLSIEPANFSSL